MKNDLKKSILILMLGASALSLCTNTALQDAVAKRDANKVRELLATGGVNLTQRDAQYKTEVDYAREKNTTPEIMVLLEAEQYKQLAAANLNDPYLNKLYQEREAAVRRQGVMAQKELR